MTKNSKYEFSLASINTFLATSKDLIRSLQHLYKEMAAERKDMSEELKDKLEKELEAIEEKKLQLFRYVHWLNLANQQYSNSRSVYIHEIVNNVEQISILYDELKNSTKEKTSI